jgi:hypothetical protein
MDHRTIDLRSIALHRAVAKKISEDPSLVKVVLKWIDEQLGQGVAHSASTRYWLRRWNSLIQTCSIEQLCELLTSPSDEMTQMRQSTPFVKVLSREERREIFRQHAKSAA